MRHPDPESLRLDEDLRRDKNWKRWGPYLPERQWGTVREDYSANGTAWEYFPHDHARSRVYRWGEDGLLGWCDREGRLCFSLALWNGRDPILKERMFGVTGNEGNHGEDVKELYYYLDSTPTHSYARALYRYPQAPYPYAELVAETQRRGKQDPEYELEDTGVFDGDRFFDVTVEYAKRTPNDMVIRVTAKNRGPETATLTLLPTLWFRNTWAWGRTGESYWPRPSLDWRDGGVSATHWNLGSYRFLSEDADEVLFTENETNYARVFGVRSPTEYVKDAFHDYIVDGRRDAVNPARTGTKAAFVHRFELPPGGERSLHVRLYGEDEAPGEPFGEPFERVLLDRRREADLFYEDRMPHGLGDEHRVVARQAYAGLLWSKQFYHFVVRDWLDGDPAQPPPPAGRDRNREWTQLYNRDVISMPDKWEYPWFAAWDLAFHTIAFAHIDPDFAKEQLVLFLREWYMHPNGQIPAYEWAFSDCNPPVHAWAAWRVYKMTGRRRERDRAFLARVFQKLVINFTWWVNRKDVAGDNLFSGGFLGLDNVGVFDRSQPLPTGMRLEQADGTAWMAFYCATMLSMALELAREDPAYEDMASKFFEHFVAIADAMNRLGGSGLWDERDGFYYDQLRVDGRVVPMRLRSMVGLTPLMAVEVLDEELIEHLPGFKRRLRWFLENRQDLAQHIAYMEAGGNAKRLLAIPSRDRLERVLRYVLDENEFLSPYGIRSMSRVYKDRPFLFDGAEVRYDPAESTSGIFGGNSNWRGPVWIPMNYLIIEALERYSHFYGDTFTVELPTGSGRRVTLDRAAHELAGRVVSLFLGSRPALTGTRFPELLFHEYFHGDTGRGLGASHQTGWTALIARLIEDLTRSS
jgi:hypothetical protein